MLDWRLKAYRNWLKLPEPHWANVQYGPIDYQAISYYAAPKQRPKLDSLDQVDPKLLETFEKLGIPSRSGNGLRAWRWTPCSIRCPSRPRSARS